jgi:pentatricopeptide repeat protein
VKALNLQALRLYCKMYNVRTDPNIFTYSNLINGLCHDNRFPEVMKLLKHMPANGLTLYRILYISNSVILQVFKHEGSSGNL